MVGMTFSVGYIHTVNPEGEAAPRDLVWTGLLQLRYYPNTGIRRDLLTELNDDEIARKWWSGEASTSPNWEWIARAAIVIDVDDLPVKVRPDSPFLNLFDH